MMRAGSRRNGTTAVLVIPEQYDEAGAGSYTPCAHIRLLQPLDHPVTGRGLAMTVDDAAAASRYHADVIITQRHAVSSVAMAEALLKHLAPGD